MNDYLIHESTLDSIVRAINNKAGTQVAMTPAQMVTAIAAIPSGGGSDPWELIVDYTSDEDAQVVLATIPEGKQNANIYRVHYKSAVGEYYVYPRINGTGGGYLTNGTWRMDFDLYVAKVPDAQNQSEVSGLSSPTYYSLTARNTSSNNVSAAPLASVGVAGYDANHPIHAGMNIKVWRLVES